MGGYHSQGAFGTRGRNLGLGRGCCQCLLYFRTSDVAIPIGPRRRGAAPAWTNCGRDAPTRFAARDMPTKVALDELRQEIDRIDDQIHDLILERAALAGRSHPPRLPALLRSARSPPASPPACGGPSARRKSCAAWRRAIAASFRAPRSCASGARSCRRCWASKAGSRWRSASPRCRPATRRPTVRDSGTWRTTISARPCRSPAFRRPAR